MAVKKKEKGRKRKREEHTGQASTEGGKDRDRDLLA